MHSFYHYLKSIGFSGYGSWIILNQSVKENHPQALSLLEITKNGDNKTNDKIYSALLNNFKETFMNLTRDE